MKTGKIKSNKRRVLRRTAVIFALSAILFGKAAFGQDSGYVTIGGSPEQYETFHSAYLVGGNSGTYTLHGGSVNMGGVINPGYQPMDMTIQFSNDEFQILDLGGSDRFLLSNGDSDINLTFDKVTLTNGNGSSNGGVISVLKKVTINGEFMFDNNQSQTSGGVIFAGNDWASGGQINVSGTNTFSNNSALGAGGAINAETINISGTNTFSDNSAAGAGGAINTGNLTLSGENTFTGNTSNFNDGGAINANKVTFNAGNYTFTGNTAKGVPDYENPGQGGAILATGVTFQSNGEPMSAEFSGNTMITSSGSVRNDIYTFGYQGVTFDGAGTYSFEGGIQTGSKSEGGLTLKNNANVTLESGSVNLIDNGLNIDGATLNIVLNEKNQYTNITTTDSAFNDGATQFTVNNVNTISNNGAMKFIINDAIQNTYYLGAIGNFSTFNGSIISQVNSGGGLAEVITNRLDSAVWLDISKGNYLATRKSNGTTVQNESNTFNGAFEAGTGSAFTTNDVVYLIGDIDATGEVKINSNVTAFGVTSNSADNIRTITATGGNRFFNVEGNTEITFDNVTFNGGNAGSNNHGGAILSDDDKVMLTLNSTGQGTTFQSNSAVNGGAIEAGTVNLNGKFYFSKNSASLNEQNHGGEGGAIDAWNITIKGQNSFTNNTAVNGGAIWAQNLTFEGTGSIAYFSNNTASGNGHDVYIAKDWMTGAPGSLTFKDNGAYGFLSGVYVDGTTEINDSAKVTYGNFSENTMNGTVTFNDTASVAFGYGSETTINGTLTINDTARLAFEDNSDMTISGMTTINAQQNGTVDRPFANDTSLKFNGGLTLGDGVKQGFIGAEVTLAGTLGVTYGGDQNAFNSQADFSSADSLTIADGTKFVIYDTAGNEMTAKDFAGKVMGENTLVKGKEDSTELKKIVPDDFSYESLLYSVSLESGQNIVLKSSEKAIRPNDIEGNAGSAAALFGKGAILDVQTADEVLVLTNGATGELFASSAAAQTERLNYINRLIIARTAVDRTVNQAGGTIRGQQAEYTDSSIFGCPSCGENNLKPNLWASGYYIGGQAQRCNNINGQTYSSGGMLTGADWTTDSGKFGAFYGYSSTDLDAIASDLESKDHTFGIWSQWDSVIGPGYTTVLGDFSFSNGEGRRFFQGNAWQSDYSAWQGAAYLERGLKFVGERFNLNPYFAMQYVGYTSDVSADAQLQYSALDADSLRTILGLRLDRDFCLRGRKANISTGFAWDHELLDTDMIFTTQRIGGGTVAPILGNSTGRDWFECNTGLSVDWSDTITLSADYYLFTNKYTTMNAGMGTVTFRY